MSALTLNNEHDFLNRILAGDDQVQDREASKQIMANAIELCQETESRYEMLMAIY